MYPFDAWHADRERPVFALLFLEAVLVALIGTAMGWLVFPAASGLIAVFLVSIGLQETFALLLDINRRDIYESQRGPYSSNAWLVAALVAMFGGCVVAFATAGSLLSTGGVRLVFETQYQLTPLRAFDLSGVSFGGFSQLMERNLSVFGLCLVISTVFRTGGGMLILAWNASVWAVSFAVLARTTMLLGAASLWRTVLAVVGGITPHLVLEGAAYVIASLVGIFLSKAIEKYPLDHPRFYRVVRASLLLILVGLGLLAAGAFAESVWPELWFRQVL